MNFEQVNEMIFRIMSKVICFFDFHTESMRSRYMIATIARIAAIAAQRSLRSVVITWPKPHAAIVATAIAEIEIFLSLRSLRSL